MRLSEMELKRNSRGPCQNCMSDWEAEAQFGFSGKFPVFANTNPRNFYCTTAMKFGLNLEVPTPILTLLVHKNQGARLPVHRDLQNPSLLLLALLKFFSWPLMFVRVSPVAVTMDYTNIYCTKAQGFRVLKWKMPGWFKASATFWEFSKHT